MYYLLIITSRVGFFQAMYQCIIQESMSGREVGTNLPLLPEPHYKSAAQPPRLGKWFNQQTHARLYTQTILWTLRFRNKNSKSSPTESKPKNINSYKKMAQGRKTTKHWNWI